MSETEIAAVILTFCGLDYRLQLRRAHDQCLIVIREQAEDGTLLGCLNAFGPLPEKRAREIFEAATIAARYSVARAYLTKAIA